MSMLSRVLEPEAMDSEEEARDYDAMDHSAVNVRFCEDLLALEPDLDPTIDVGTGTALIPITLCRLVGRARVTAIDLADSMLALGAHNVREAGLSNSISLAREDAKALSFADGSFACVMSNSIVHHLPHPAVALHEMLRVLRAGGVLFVRDLMRPADDAAVRALVAMYAANEDERQRGLFEASLRAALTLDEMRGLVEEHGIPASAVRATSDRHWTLAYRTAKDGKARG